MYEKFVHLLGGDSSDPYIDRMQFGTGTLAPAATQTFLQRPITPVKAVTPAIVPSYSATFQAYLLADEANGFPLAEAGLLAVDDTLLARATYTAQTKTVNYIWGYSWTVTVKSGDQAATDFSVPVEDGALASLVFGALITGESEAGTTYGDLITPQDMTLTGMQATVLGQPPAGDDLIIRLVVNGSEDASRTVTVGDGTTSGQSTFGTAYEATLGTRLQVKVHQVGSTDPGDWVLVYYQTSVSPT